LKARPEPTQWEHLSDASFLGKLLLLPPNVRLDWKVIVRYKHSSLFGLVVSNERKKFYDIDTWSVTLMMYFSPGKGLLASSTNITNMGFPFLATLSTCGKY
jgi:hypothetical protein